MAETRTSIENESGPVDVFLAQQIARFPDGRLDKNVWLAGLEGQIKDANQIDSTGAYHVVLDDILKVDGFSHLNTTILKRSFFESLGGFDETLRYEEDRDLFFRAIDSARRIKFRPAYIAMHNVPEKALKASESTRISDYSKKIYQLNILEKQILFSKNKSIRRLARMQKGYTLKNITMELYNEKRFYEANIYAREALSVAFGVKWMIFTLFILTKKK